MPFFPDVTAPTYLLVRGSSLIIQKTINTMSKNEIGKQYFLSVSKRLKLIRSELKISQRNLEKLLGLTLKAVSRLEDGEGGSMINLFALIWYYTEQGYNINWMLSYDNSNYFKKDITPKNRIDPKLFNTLFSKLEQSAKEFNEYITEIN